MSKRAWYTIKNLATAPAAEISILDEIGAWGVTARNFSDQLSMIAKDRPIQCVITSNGGSVWDAIAIYNLLNARRSMVTTKVIGVAASAASIVALAGGKTIMSKGSMMMIHNPMGTVYDAGSEELRKYADLVDQIGGQLRGIYAAETGLDEDELEEMMDATTWLPAEECLSKGFCDEIGEAIAISARSDLRRFNKVPKAFLKDLADATPKAGTVKPPEPAQQPTEQAPDTMKNLLIALAAVKLIDSADSTEETAIAQVRANFGKLSTENTDLKTENQQHLTAKKTRVENRVKAAIAAKIAKPEREAQLIKLGMQDETNLDLLDEVPKAEIKGASTTPPRRGIEPIAKDDDKGEAAIDSALANIHAEMRSERDPVKVGILAKQARELRASSKNAAAAGITYSKI